MHRGQKQCSQPRAVRRAALFTQVQFPHLTVATLISLRSMEMLFFIPKIPTSSLGVQEHEPNLNHCHLNRTAGVLPLISLTHPWKITLLKISVIHVQIRLRSFPFYPPLDVYGLWHKILITKSDSGRGYEQVGRVGYYVGEWLCARVGSRCVSRCCQRLSLCLKILFWIRQFLRAILHLAPMRRTKQMWKMDLRGWSRTHHPTIEISETSMWYGGKDWNDSSPSQARPRICHERPIAQTQEESN